VANDTVYGKPEHRAHLVTVPQITGRHPLSRQEGDGRYSVSRIDWCFISIIELIPLPHSMKVLFDAYYRDAVLPVRTEFFG
jgi:hypothetical protein